MRNLAKHPILLLVLCVANTTAFAEDHVSANQNVSSVRVWFLSDAKIQQMNASQSQGTGMGMGMADTGMDSMDGGMGMGVTSSVQPKIKSKAFEVARVRLDGNYIGDVLVSDWDMDLTLNLRQGEHSLNIVFPSHVTFDTKFTAVGNGTRQLIVVKLSPKANQSAE